MPHISQPVNYTEIANDTHVAIGPIHRLGIFLNFEAIRNQVFRDQRWSIRCIQFVCFFIGTVIPKIIIGHQAAQCCPAANDPAADHYPFGIDLSSAGKCSRLEHGPENFISFQFQVNFRFQLGEAGLAEGQAIAGYKKAAGIKNGIQFVIE